MSLKHFLTRLSAVFMAATVLMAATSCSRQERATSLQQVRMSFATPPYTLLADVAQAQGFFREEGLDVIPLFHATGKESLEDVLGGQSDFATVAETPIMFAAMRGADMSIIATIQTSSRNAAICGRKDRGIRVPGDLRGKRIATRRGTIAEFFMDAFLAANGISPKNVTVVDLRPEESPGALERGDIDAIAAFPPFLSEAQTSLGGRAVTFYDENIYTQTFNIVTTRKYARANPGTIKRLLQALVRAEDLFDRDPEKAQAIVADFRKMDRGRLRAMLEGNNFEVALDQQLILALEDESRWAVKSGLVGATKVPNYLDSVYLNGLASMRPQKVRILH